MDAKAHKKYFNTAPARLKPEKHSRKLTDILKPKSSSCAAILMDKPEPQELYDIVPQEVMSSFKHAVNELEQTSPTRNPYFGPQGIIIPHILHHDIDIYSTDFLPILL